MTGQLALCLLSFPIRKKGSSMAGTLRTIFYLHKKAVNLLDNKYFGGNLALKVNVSKAFDTLDQEFLLKIISKFDFNQKFYSWMSSILQRYISTLNYVFTRYSSVFGHVFSKSKPTIFSSSNSVARLDTIVASTGFAKVIMPFNYLRVLVFKGNSRQYTCSYW